MLTATKEHEEGITTAHRAKLALYSAMDGGTGSPASGKHAAATSSCQPGGSLLEVRAPSLCEFRQSATHNSG
jgi:hypothetical protein